MKNSASLKSVTQPLIGVLRRYHLVIFVLIVAGSLAAAIFILNGIVHPTSEPTATTPPTNFDTQTMEKIRKLQTREMQNSEISLPEGRINLFGE